MIKRWILTLGALFLVLAIASKAHAQTPSLPTPPPASPAPPSAPVPTVNRLPVGVLDAATAVMIAGHAEDSDSPDAALTVQITSETPDGRVQYVATLSAESFRSDVGAHAFGMLTATTSLCDGREHKIHASAFDAQTGQPQEIIGSPKSLTCGTKAQAISGTVKNVAGNAITSDSWNRTWVTLNKFDDLGNALFFSQSQVDASGNFSFVSGLNGENLTSGKYELEVEAKGYLYDHVTFTYDRSQGTSLPRIIEKAKVFIEAMGMAPNIPTNGQYLMPLLRVCNQGFAGGQYGSVPARVTITGRGQISQYNTTPDQTYYIAVPPDPGTCWVYTPFWLTIDASLPDGHQYCADIKVIQDGEPNKVWSETLSCGAKGVKENLGNLRAEK